MDFFFGGDLNLVIVFGIVYVFYDDILIIDGLDLIIVLMDLVLNMILFIIFNGFEFDQENGIWLVFIINSFGNFDLINNGSLQEVYNMGVLVLIQFWFVLIIVDNVLVLEYEQGGFCVSVSIDEVFLVVYFESIVIIEIFVDFVGGLEGSFVLQGGLLEFDFFIFYIIIINEIGGGVMGMV